MNKLKSSVKSYWDWRSESYDAENSAEVINKWESILKKLIADSPGNRALDVGAGTGFFAICLARGGFKVTALDISEGMLSQAKQKALNQGLTIDFHLGDAEHLHFEDHSFDVVVSRNLLWTLPDPELALKEWRRVMRPGAVLVVSDGFWLNHTWKRIHHSALLFIKRLIRNENFMLPIRFFMNYSGAQKSLPFYEGIHFEEAEALLAKAGFREVKPCDLAHFGVNPYSIRKGFSPSFFIASAKK